MSKTIAPLPPPGAYWDNFRRAWVRMTEGGPKVLDPQPEPPDGAKYTVPPSVGVLPAVTVRA